MHRDVFIGQAAPEHAEELTALPDPLAGLIEGREGE